jgi:hypothetical protein
MNNSNISISTTPLVQNNTSSKPKEFCFSCGFNFGHIADGIEDTTMGLILVAIAMLLVGLISCAACYGYMNYKGKGKRKKGQKSYDSFDETDDYT